MYFRWLVFLVIPLRGVAYRRREVPGAEPPLPARLEPSAEEKKTQPIENTGLKKRQSLETGACYTPLTGVTPGFGSQWTIKQQ